MPETTADLLQRFVAELGDVAIILLDAGGHILNWNEGARALLGYTHDKGADLLVMGAYGRGQVLSFLGLGGATGKVISSCRVPLLMAH